MSISSSMNAGVLGLSANAIKLATISDNIANASTMGYKRSETDFHSMVVGSGGDGSYTAGGVTTTSGRLVDERGSLVSTSNATDIAVRGRGFVPVTSEAAVKSGANDLPMFLQTTGSFRADAQGYLTSPSGQVLMGWPADPDGTIPAYPRDNANELAPVQINVNEFAGEPTTEIGLGVNLPATSAQGGVAGPSEVLSVDYYNPLGIAGGLDIDFTPTGTDNQWGLTVTDQSDPLLTGSWTVQFDNTLGGGGNLISATPIGASPPWNAATGVVQFPVPNGQTIDINIGAANSRTGLTQLSDTFAPTAISKNGSPVGNIVEVEVDQNGMVNALYDIGISRTLYQVPLADVANPNGLRALDNQTYQVSGDSGDFFLWDAGSGPTGEIVNFAREQSTTDVAKELTDLIQTQRAYSSNAKVIQTVDEMLQETTNIKR